MTDGKRMRISRVAASWTRYELARRSGLSAYVIGAIERGERKISDEEMEAVGLALAGQLGGTIFDFFPTFAGRATDGANSVSVE